jgi:uncharacterized protein YbjT (DUF2867 family)
MSGLRSVVAGASGLVGGHLVHRLAEDGAFDEVRLLVRKELTPFSPSSPKLPQEVVDFGTLSKGQLGRPDVVFCALGTTIAKAGSEEAFRKVDLEAVVHLAWAASEAGARQLLVVSSLGADPKASTFYLRVKGEMERALRAFPFEGLQIFRPSLLLGDRKEVRIGERVAALLAAPLGWAMVGPAARYRPIEADAVAAAMVRVAKGAPLGANVYESEGIRRLASGLPQATKA